jgi:hypothetical protein
LYAAALKTAIGDIEFRPREPPDFIAPALQFSTEFHA